MGVAEKSKKIIAVLTVAGIAYGSAFYLSSDVLISAIVGSLAVIGIILWEFHDRISQLEREKK